MHLKSFKDIDLQTKPIKCGFYSLGIIEDFYPNIKVIDACQWRLNHSGDRYGNMNYKWLRSMIEGDLKHNKIVLVIPEDEDVMFPMDMHLVDTLNEFIDSSCYFVTQMPDFMIYRDAGIKCKMLELPWMMVNDCLCFNHVVKYGGIHISHPKKHNKGANFISLVGRAQHHKISVLNTLCDMNLAKFGILTVSDKKTHNNLPQKVKDECSLNQNIPYNDYEEYRGDDSKSHELYADEIRGFKEGGFTKICNIWVSANVVNFLKIRDLYSDVPLVVHAETTTGLFPMTEKSIWPILLGKLFLIHGHQGVMHEVQRFYDINIADFANIEFDDMHGWGVDNDNIRLNKMIVDNKSLIENASEKYKELKPQLDKSSYTFGENMYNFFITQIQSIYHKI